MGYYKSKDGQVLPAPGRLIYRGIDIKELVEEAYAHDRFVFEEVIWLLLFGNLPRNRNWKNFAHCWKRTANCRTVLWKR